jgi:hypothetical protein
MTKPHSGKSRWRFGVPIPSERPPNRRVATLLCGLLFLIEGLALTIFGSVDVVNRGAGFHPRLVGFMFLLAGVLLIVEAFVLFAVSRRETPRLEGPAGTVALIAPVAGSLSACMRSSLSWLAEARNL